MIAGRRFPPTLIAVALASAAAGVARAEDVGHVAIVRTPQAAYAPEDVAPKAEVARAFFASHGDAYDFLVVFPAMPVDLASTIPGETRGRQVTVRNTVSGIGVPPIDSGWMYGSRARLKGFVDVYALVPGATAFGEDETVFVVAHEIAHQWSGRARFRDPVSGQASSALLGREGTHWSAWLDSDASVLYGSDWRDAGGGTFVADASLRRYSPLDLYLMGFAPGSEVKPITLLRPSGTPALASDALPPPDGTAIAATARTISVDDVIAAEGIRTPAVAQAQRAFRAAFVLAVGPGQEPTAAQIAYVDAIRRDWANRFFFLTGGRAVMETDLVEPAAKPLAASPSVRLGLDYLLASQAASGAWEENGLAVRASTSAARALALFPSDAPATSALARAAAWLASIAAADVDSAARRATALSAAGVPPVATAPFDAAAANADGGLGLAPGYGSSVIDSVLAGLARTASGRPQDEVDAIATYLVTAQNMDGGWPDAPGGASRIETTAWALQLLVQATPRTEVVLAAQTAVAYLDNQRLPEGAFGEERLARDTAEAVLALDAWRALGAGQAQVSAEYLLGQQLADGSWNGSVHDTGLVLRALRVLLSTNLAVDPDSLALSPTHATDGEPVRLRVRVENVGRANATSVLVRAFDSDGEPFGPGTIVPLLAASAFADVSLVLDTTGHAGSTQVFVVVDPDGAVEQVSREDDRAAAPLPIGPRPAGPDVTVYAHTLASVPDRLTRFPAPITVTATVANLGLTAAPGTQVALLLDGAVLATATVDLAAASTATVSLAATLPPLPGAALLEVAVNRDGRVPDTRTDNDSATLLVPLVPTVDLAVADLRVNPLPAEQGRDLEILFSVPNAGTADASGAHVGATIETAAGEPIAALPGFTAAIPRGGAVQARLVWRAVDVRAARVRAFVELAGDGSPSDNQAVTSVSVTPATVPNLAVGASSLRVSPDPPHEASEATVSATIANQGAAAGAFDVTLYAGDPATGGAPVGTRTVASLGAGASTDASFPWTPPSSAPVMLVLVVDPADAVQEFDEQDNVVLRVVTPASVPDLVLGDADLVPDTAYPRPGDPVTLAVSVLNAGGQESAATTVTLRLDGAAGPIVDARPLGPVAPQQRGEVAFTWSTAGLSGAHALFAEANPDRAAPESSYANNAGSRRFVLQDGAVAVSERYFSPNGDGVKDATTIYYRLAAPAPATVQIATVEGKIVRTAELPVGADAQGFTWDGKAETGRLADDGEYRATVFAGALVGTAPVVLDTNRTRLESVTDPKQFLQYPRDLGGLTPDRTSDVKAAGDDSGWYVLQRQSTPSFACGFYFRPRLADVVQRLSPDGWPEDEAPPPGSGGSRAWWREYRCESVEAWDVSPDGRSVAYIPAKYLKSDVREVELLDTATGTQRVLATGGAWNVDAIFGNVHFTPDSSRVFFQTGAWYYYDYTYACSGWEVFAHGLWSVDLTGAVRPESPVGNGDFAISPDGTLVAGHRSSRYCDYWGGWATEPEGFAVGPVAPRYAGDSITAWSEHDFSTWLPDGRAIALTHSDAYMGGETRWELIEDVRNRSATFPIQIYASHVVNRAGDALAWVRDGGTSAATVVVMTPVGGATRDLLHVANANLLRTWSPFGTFLEVAMGGNTTVVSSVAALTAELAVTRAPGAKALTLFGTAADQNFESYTVSVRPLGSTAEPTVIRRSGEPVIRDVLTAWTPPGAGTYEILLRVRDLAGNEATRRARAGWSLTPAIANLRVDPIYISPNGDGVQDEAQVAYSAVLPVTAQFSITGPTGTVRTFDRTHVDSADASFAWDGRDDAGATVSDGAYSVAVEGISAQVVVDTVPPDVSMELTVPGTVLDPTRILAEAGAVSWPCTGGTLVTTVQHARPALADDEPGTTLELLMQEPGGGAFQPLPPDPVGGYTYALAAVGGNAFRATARDRAGNSAQAEAVAPEFLLVTGYGDASALDGAPSCVAGAREVPPLHLLSPILNDVRLDAALHIEPTPDSIPFEHQRYAFSVASTIRQPIVSFAMAYEPFGVRVVDRANVTWLSDQSFLWDASELPYDLAGHSFSIVATDATGRTFTAPLAFSRRAEMDVCDRAGPPQQAKVRVTVNAPEPGDALAPGATIEFWPALRLPGSPLEKASAAPELVAPFDATGAPGDGPGDLVYAALAPTGALTGCDYILRLSGRALDGRRIEGETVLDACGVHLVPIEPKMDLLVRNGDQVTMIVGETYRKPVSSVDVYLRDYRDPPGTWTYAATVSPSRETAPSLTVRWSQCGWPQLRFVTRFQDGTEGDTAPPPGSGQEPEPLFHACRPFPDVLACVDLSLSAVRVDPEPPRCSPARPSWRVSLDGKVWAGEEPFTSVDAWLARHDGSTAAPLALLPFAPGSTVHASATFGPDGLPEGKLVARAHVANGTSWRGLESEPVIVDRTAPRFGIQSPAAGESLCPIVGTAPDGTEARTFVIRGDVSDDWLERFVVSYRPLDGPFRDRVVFESEAPRLFSKAGVLAEIPGRELPPGSYELIAEARDASGSSFCLPARLFHVSGAVHVSGAAAFPWTFSPDGDGVLEATELRYLVTAPSHVTASVKLPDGSWAAFYGADVEGQQTIAWGGTTPAGAQLPDGRAELRISAKDRCGESASETVAIELDRAPPVVSIAAPAPGAAVGSLLTVAGEVSDAHLDRYELAFASAAQPDAWQVAEVVQGAARGVLGSVSLRDLPQGDYVVRVTAWDTVGHEAHAAVTVRLVPAELISSLGARPALVSPNGDGRRETAAAEIDLRVPARVAFDLVDATDAVVAPVMPAVDLPAGPFSFPVGAAALAGVADGSYALRATATAAGYAEVVSAVLEIDRSVEILSVSAPAAGAYVRGDAAVMGEIADARLQQWTVVLADDGAAERPIASGSAPVTGILASAGELSDGPHRVIVRARDAAENLREVVVPFVSDVTLPVAAFETPLAGELIDGSGGPVRVAASVQEANLARVTIDASGAGGATTRILDAAELPGDLVEASWGAGAGPEGEVTLLLAVEDRAGNRVERRIDVRVDRSAPFARITSPSGTRLFYPWTFEGAVGDDNLEQWDLAIGSGPPGAAVDLLPVAAGTAGVGTATADATLAVLRAPLADGLYTARLTATDRVGHQASVEVAFTVDATPFADPPTGLVATVEPPRDVRLTWNASAAPGVQAYGVYRGRAGAPPSATFFTTVPATETSLVDYGLPDGDYWYAVAAMDAAGMGEKSATVPVTIDGTPPLAAITTPAADASVGGIVEVVGTAASSDFDSYVLSVGPGAAPVTFTTLRASPASVRNDVLGALDCRSFPDGQLLTIRLQASDAAGNVATATTRVTVDNTPPGRPTLHSASPSGSSVVVAWAPNAEPDLAGYLLFRNGTLANAPEGADLSRLSAWLVPPGGASYLDAGLPDGTFTYTLQAVDKAGNLSPLSAAVSVTLDARAPAAIITTPQPLARVLEPTAVEASAVDLDVASVRFEARMSPGSPFAPIAPALTRPPWKVDLDPAAFAPAVLEVRAVATDLAGNVDASPASVFVFADETPLPPVVATSVSEYKVSVSWPGTPVADWYEVTRDTTVVGSAARPAGTATATSTGSGTPDYAYGAGTWTSASGAPQEWRLTLLAPAVIERVESATAVYAATVDVVAKVRGTWVSLARNVAAGTPVSLSQPLEVEAIAFQFLTSPAGKVDLKGVNLVALPVVHVPPVVDSSPLGWPVYTVAAMTRFGTTASGVATAHVYQPTLVPDATTVATQVVHATGTADAGSVVHVLNGAKAEIATAQAGADGAYDVQIPLQPGANNVFAYAVDPSGNRSMTTDAGWTTCTIPKPPTNLTARLYGSVSGRYVSLSFYPSGDLAQLNSWVLDRTNPDGTVASRYLPGQVRSYNDSLPGPGTYQYTITPIDKAWAPAIPSNTVTLSVAPPNLGAILALDGVSGSDVTLSFTPTGDVSRLAGYYVEREGADGVTQSWVYADATTFTDTWVPSGHYRYTVTPVDQNNFSGTTSNAVEVDLAGPPTALPYDLVVTAPPAGGSLLLSWSYTGPGGLTFSIERAPAAGGPFASAGSTTALSFRDGGLTNGVTYYYRVWSYDPALGTTSPAALGSGTPLRTTPPAPPWVAQPTVTGKPITVTVSQTTISGVAEPSSVVALSANGSVVATTTAASYASTILSPIATKIAAAGFGAVSPDGLRVGAVFTPPESSRASLAVEDVTTGQVTLFAPPDASFTAAPAFSPDGSRIAAAATRASDGRTRIYVGDVATGALSALAPDGPGDQSAPAWSPDGAQIAFEETNGTDVAVSVAPAVGGARLALASEPGGAVFGPAWLDAASIAAIVKPASYYADRTLVRLDAATGTRTTLASAGAMERVAASPDGRWLAYVGGPYSNSNRVNVLDRSDAVAPPVVLQVAYAKSIAFSPLEAKVAVLTSGGSLAIGDLELRTTLQSAWLGTGALSWTASNGLLHAPDWGAPSRVDWGGAFTFSAVLLEPGTNMFTATAMAADCPTASLPSPVVEVRLDVNERPDLSVSAAVDPATPVRGKPATAAVTVRNVGGDASAYTSVDVRVLVPDGSFRRAPPMSVPPLAPGASFVGFAPLDLAGLTGAQRLVATVDPTQSGDDADRSNNQVTVPFTILEDGVLSVQPTVAPLAVGVDGAFAAHVAIVNGGPTLDLVLWTSLVDTSGNPVTIAPDQSYAPLATGAAATFDRTLAVGTALAGAYAVAVVAQAGGTEISRATVPVTIVPDRTVVVALTGARAGYGAGEAIDLEAIVQNLSRNAPLSGATVRLEALDTAGTAVLALPPQPLPFLWLGTEARVPLAIAAGALGAGSWTARAIVSADGVDVGQATVAFAIAAEPLLAASLTIPSAAEPPTVKAGAAVPATAAFRNVGSGDALNVAAELVISDGQGVEIARTPFPVGDLAAGAESSATLAVPTDALGLGAYGLTLVARYDGREEVLATARFRIADGQPPALAFVTLRDGTFVRASVVAAVRATDDASGTASVIATSAGATTALARQSGTPLDGVWSGSISFPAEGTYEVVAFASDAEGNGGLATPSATNPIHVVVVSDVTPPAVAIGGVAEGALVRPPVALSVQASDLHLASADARLDGVPWDVTLPVTADGEHLVSVEALDLAGNSAADSVRFTIDGTSPSVTIAGIDDGSVVARDVTPVVVVTDLHLDTSSITLDGQPFVPTTLASDADHVLAVDARDLAGNETHETVRFAIDRTLPTVSITGVAEGAFAAGPVTPTFSAQDAHLLSTEATLDGVAFRSGDRVSAEGAHVLRVTALDAARNTTTLERRFTIDTTAPEIWTSVQEGAQYDERVTVSFGATDANLDAVTATLDGAPFTSGTVLESAGSHVLVVTATDRAGHSTTTTVRFSVVSAARFTVVKRLLASHASALVLVGCSDPTTPRTRAFLAAALPAARLTFVSTDVDFLVELRSGAHDVFVLTDALGVRSTCVPTYASPPLSRSVVGQRVEQELTEAAYRGAGILTLRTTQNAWPKLAEALGLTFEGDVANDHAAIVATAVSGPMRLAVPDGVDLRLREATDAGRFEGSRGVALAVRPFGAGASVTLGFDPAAAAPAGDATALVSGAASYLSGDRRPGPRGVVAVQIELTNEGAAADVVVRETLDPALAAVWAFDGGTVKESTALEWSLHQNASETASLEYLVRLPIATGTYGTVTDVLVSGLDGLHPAGTFPFAIAVAQDGPALLASAESAASAIPSYGIDATRRAALLAKLAAVRANPGATAADREQAIADLLDAASVAQSLQSVDPLPVRLAVSDLLAFWEAMP